MADKQIYTPDFIVSVCVVTYNHEKYIEKCVESILNQETDFLFEIVIANDASTDKTLEKLIKLQAKYPQRLCVISHEVNVGPYENYRLVHQQASGVYIAHCDGDDYWLPGKLQKQVDFLRQHNDCVAVYTNADVINESGKLIARFNGNNIPTKFDINYLVAKSNFLCHSSLVYRAELRNKVIPTLDAFVDYHVHINLAKFGLLAYINMQGVVYRYNSVESLVKTSGDKVNMLINDAVLSAKNELLNKTMISFDCYSSSRQVVKILKYNKPSKWRIVSRTTFGTNGYYALMCGIVILCNKCFSQVFLNRINRSSSLKIIFPR